ncbi:hypothetical protein L1999_15330 [Neobacillus drentensis]|uniref:hypothetical protein n=1 Tax=Neobacillus drentensis TaxID=220684 RepID=UPI001F2CF3F6|nr:hypothetical protein [Neobacillus drentensis]ULT54538.1 hypothetical protein L1999_15330 [Neobacillus drentensis]
MERREVFENWFRFVNRDTESSSFERNEMIVESESISRTTGHHSNIESSSNHMGHESSEQMTSTDRGDVRDITASTCQ